MPRTVDGYLRLPRRRYFSAVELHAVAIGSIAAVVLIIGYGFNVDLFQRLLPGFPTMRPRTAFAFMLLSLSCLLSLRESKQSRALSSIVAAGTVLWVISLVISNWGQEQDGESILVPIQASLVSLILGCVAMLIINLAPRYGTVAGALALAPATFALYRVMTLLLFWGAPGEQASLLSSMAIHTAILIVWFMTACVLMHPRLGFATAILQSSLRGRLLRRALPFVLLLPVVAAAGGLGLALAFGWPNEALFALTATLSVAIGASLIWWLSQLVQDWQKEANNQASRLSRANEALEQYASSAAHDLKAPARHVMLYGELLEAALANGDVALAKKHARAIAESAADMPKLIDGLLDYSRSAFIRINPSNHPLSELVQAAAVQNAPDIEASGAHIVLDQDVQLRCDSTLITTVFQNLFANSIKNRRKDKPLVIRIDAAQQDGSWDISVADNGVGFDPDFASVAFNPLARGVQTAGEGTGIGLSTCRNIVQSHGGEIRVDPAFRGGARIRFTLPVEGKAERPPNG
jgi:signal transduction histidine kinase